MEVGAALMVLCANCRNEPRRPGQRWGVECFREYMRAYRRGVRKTDSNKTPNQRIDFRP